LLRLRLAIARRRLSVLRLRRGARHQLRALQRLLALLRNLTLLGLTLLGKRPGLTGIRRSAGRVAGGLIHRLLLFRTERNRNETQANVISR
jgi:hypothetical protein